MEWREVFVCGVEVCVRVREMPDWIGNNRVRQNNRGAQRFKRKSFRIVGLMEKRDTHNSAGCVIHFIRGK